MQPQGFFQYNWRYHLCAGGVLRNQRHGRGLRPLSRKDPIHVVFKVNKTQLQTRGLRSAKSFSLIHQIIKKYSRHFGIKVEQLSIQNDHIHILVRSAKRSQFKHFFRVVAGQIAQRFEKRGFLKVTDTPKKKGRRGSARGTGLWKLRPFSRVVKGWKAYKIVRDYIQLNEQEANGVIRYQPKRLKGLSLRDWQLLWRVIPSTNQ